MIAIVSFVGVCTLLAIVAVFLMEKQYQSQARLIVEDRVEILDEEGVAVRNDGILDAAGVNSQLQIIQSRYLAAKVIDRFNLFTMLRSPRSLGYIPTVGMGLDGIDERVPQASEKQFDAYYASLKVFAAQDSRSIDVIFKYNDPQTSADVVNFLVDQYMEMLIRAKRQNSDEDANTLLPEVRKLEIELKKAEGEVAQYRAEQGLLGTGDPGLNGAGGQLLVQQQLTIISDRYAAARVERGAREAAVKSIRRLLQNGDGADSTAEALASPILQAMTQRRARLQEGLAQLLIDYLPGHPRIKTLEAQLATVNQQYQDELQRALAGAQDGLDRARSQERQAKQQLTQAETRAAEAQEKQVIALSLSREVSSRAEQLQALRTRYHRAAAKQRAGQLPPDARIVSRASAPDDHASPQSGLIVMIAFGASLMLALAFVTLSELMRVFSATSSQPMPHGGGFARSDLPYPGQVQQGFAAHASAPSYMPQQMPTPTHVPSNGANHSSRYSAAQPTALSTANASSAGQNSGAGMTFGAAARSAVQPSNSARSHDIPGGVMSGSQSAASQKTTRQSDRSAPLVASDESVPDVMNIAMVCKELSNSSLKQHLSVLVASGLSERSSDMAYVIGRSLNWQLKTILVDLSIDQNLAVKLGGKSDKKGFVDLCNGEAGFASALQVDKNSGLNFMPAGAREQHNGAVKPEGLKDVLQILSQSFDRVLVNLGGLSGSALEVAFLKAANSVLVGAGPLNSDRDAANFVAEKLINTGMDGIYIVTENAEVSKNAQGIA